MTAICDSDPLGVIKLQDLAESLQVRTVDAVKLHPELQDRYCKDLSRLQIGAFDERSAIFIQSGNDGTQMRLGI